MCLDNLKVTEKLDDDDFRLVWCNKVLAVRTATKSMIGKGVQRQGQDRRQFGEKATAVIQECR